MFVSTVRNNRQVTWPDVGEARPDRFTHFNDADVRRYGMKLLKAAFSASALGIALLGAATQSASAGCQLNSPGGHIKRVVYLIFDNVHLRRDNPNVPSDLEQMPNLLNFLQGKRRHQRQSLHAAALPHGRRHSNGVDGGLWRSSRQPRLEQLRDFQKGQFRGRFPDVLRLLDDQHGAEPS